MGLQKSNHLHKANVFKRIYSNSRQRQDNKPQSGFSHQSERGSGPPVLSPEFLIVLRARSVKAPSASRVVAYNANTPHTLPNKLLCFAEILPIGGRQRPHGGGVSINGYKPDKTIHKRFSHHRSQSFRSRYIIRQYDQMMEVPAHAAQSSWLH